MVGKWQTYTLIKWVSDIVGNMNIGGIDELEKDVLEFVSFF